jgi:phosphate transport system substrate-binding protein
LSEVQGIFAAGTGSKWTVISREAGSGTREVFEEKVMAGVQISANAEYLGYNGAVKQKVAGTPNAIGYLSLGYVDSSVKTVTIDNVACTPENCLNNSYPISRFLNFITMGEPEGITLDFLKYCLSKEGQSIVADEGYIRVN